MTDDLLNKLLLYQPATGKLYWKERQHKDFINTRSRILKAWNKRWASKEAFTAVGTHGYLTGAIFGKNYLAHRVAWALYYGDWPELYIDHIDGNRTNNIIGNLRAVSLEENTKNSSLRSDNTSGVTGVHKSKNGKWFVRVSQDKQYLHIGTFDTFEQAVKGRKEAEVKYGYHENHGRPIR